MAHGVGVDEAAVSIAQTPGCVRSFTESSRQVAPRRRVTARLCAAIALADVDTLDGGGGAVTFRVRLGHGVAWPSPRRRGTSSPATRRDRRDTWASTRPRSVATGVSCRPVVDLAGPRGL